MALAAPLLLPILLVAALSQGVAPREELGVFEGWGAYRDVRPFRCFAIAEPGGGGADGAATWRPFAAISSWPGSRVRGQLHVRLRRVKRPGTPAYLTIGERRFLLASGGAEAWAPDARADAAIVAAMRGAASMSVTAVDLAGRPFGDSYRLRGAASAIDAAALGCVAAG